MTTTSLSPDRGGSWGSFKDWITSTNNRLYIGWFGVLMIPTLQAHYDGCTVCPLITGYNNVVMAEFDYSQKPISSFLIDPTKERWSMWLMKTRMLPWLYWNRMIKGLPHEGRYLRPLRPLVHLLRLDYREPSAAQLPAAGESGGSC